MKKIIICLFLAISSFLQLQAQGVKPFETGDKVAFLGNSITEAGFYESNIWLYYMTHFPDKRITVYNTGIGGDVVEQMNKRFEYDVLPKNPNIVVLTFGMNDTGYSEFNAPDADETARQRIEKSFKNFGFIQQKLKAQPQIQTVIMSSSPYDETMKNKNNYYKGKAKAMEQIVAFQKKAAKDNNWPYVDLFYPMTAINIREQKSNPEYTLTGSDRIHPGKAGHLVMAGMFLENQGLAGKPVANVVVDTKKGLISAENADVNITQKSDAVISFDYTAKSLPFPIDSLSDVWGNPQKQFEALAVYPFIKNFNQEILKVTSLKKGIYSLVIDGKQIRTFTADSLAKGVNMALINTTPQYQQAKEIMYLNDLRTDLEKKMRDYYWLQFNYFQAENLLFNDSQMAFDKVQEKAKTDGFVNSKMDTYKTARFPEVRTMWQNNIQQLTEEIYSINQPKTHLIQIVVEK